MMFSRGIAVALIGLDIVSGGAGAVAARAADAPASAESCFRSNDWSSWKAAPDARSLYISVNGNRVYRLDLAQACPALTSIGVHLVTRPRGGGWICRPADMDLKIADDHGFTTPCIVSGITPLSPDEAKALPKALQP
jgi:hypothetical protein